MASIPPHLRLSPQPFRQWCVWRLDPVGWERPNSEPEDGALAALSMALNLEERKLHRWRNEAVYLERFDVEDALRHAGFELWDVWPNFEAVHSGYCADCKDVVPADANFGCLWCGRLTRRRDYGATSRLYSNLTDAQLHGLHELHEQGVTIRELGRRVYRSTGYRSWESAEKGIRIGFGRLGLPAIKGSDRALRRCAGTKTLGPRKGTRCKKPPTVGSGFCREHDPQRRDEVLRIITRASEASRQDDRQVAA